MRKYLSIMSKKTKLKCMGIIILAFLSSLLASVWPVRLGKLYNSISSGSVDFTMQSVLAVLTFGAVYLSSECITIFRRVALDCIIATHESEVREKSIEKMLKMPIAYYSGSLSGEKTAQLNQGVAGFSQLIKILCNDVFATALTAVCTLIQVFFNAPVIMVLIMMLYLTFTIIVSIFQIKSQNGIRESIVGQKNVLEGQVCQSITNLELIRSMNAEIYEKNRLLPEILKISSTEKKHHRYMGTFDCIKQACKIVFQIIILLLSIVLVSNGSMATGSVITVCLLFQQLVKPIDDVYRFMDETASSVIKAKTLFEVTCSATDSVYDIQSYGSVYKEKNITIENLIVTNPEKNQNLAWYEDLYIPGDKTIALQGPNGCGKSSLIRCLNRYYPYSQGKIKIFGRDLNDYSQKELTEIFYYTPQTSFFISGTIRENLLYGINHEVDDGVLVEALYAVHLVGTGHKDTVIRANPVEALECQIGENANELSGGMKQRLSLARAFLRSPKMYVFDEITANLDKEATDFVLSNIEAHAKKIGAGIIYISHDQKVVDRCEMIIALKNRLRNEKGVEVA